MSTLAKNIAHHSVGQKYLSYIHLAVYKNYCIYFIKLHNMDSMVVFVERAKKLIGSRLERS